MKNYELLEDKELLSSISGGNIATPVNPLKAIAEKALEDAIALTTCEENKLGPGYVLFTTCNGISVTIGDVLAGETAALAALQGTNTKTY